MQPRDDHAVEPDAMPPLAGDEALGRCPGLRCCGRRLPAWLRARSCRCPLDTSRSSSWLDAVEQFGGAEEGADERRPHRLPLLRVPDSPTRRRWDMLLYLLVLYSVFYFSFTSAFLLSFRAADLAGGYLVDCIFMLDIALNLHTCEFRSFAALAAQPS